MKPVQTLVLIANEKEVRLLANAGVGKGLRELSHFDRMRDPSMHPRYSDAPGRSQASPGAARHGYERTSSEREQSREAFADLALKITADEWAHGLYNRLVITAPPEMLGALRAAMSVQLSQALVADMNKDLIKVATADLPRHFEEVIVF
ncbi:protein required for attachment to host cells [Rhodovulum iodosum]|uniref:Protein required for attachment to host cells n=1 Tax=Rhodovulum iodosum TaxID=68291 RepID=A0ABV3XP42_9RHOB|nr:host attachment protein [Rhodovulum robiginosum]RSK31598.1 hypothetical protein EJA01_15840 [Rhodovulum robiginosum]